MKFSRQEYKSGLPFPSLGYLHNPGIEPGSLALQADFFLSEPSGTFPFILQLYMECIQSSFIDNDNDDVSNRDLMVKLIV